MAAKKKVKPPKPPSPMEIARAALEAALPEMARRYEEEGTTLERMASEIGVSYRMVKNAIDLNYPGLVIVTSPRVNLKDRLPELARLYHEEGLPLSQLAEREGVDPRTIRTAFEAEYPEIVRRNRRRESK
jgi:lambda repressor-like predicted transcriptional regulator